MTSADDTPSSRPSALIGWRLLALFYDFWPVLALWMLTSAMFTVGYTLSGHGIRENIPPWSATQAALWLACWLLTGVYATLSWRRGGQTLGMRPWRLRLVGHDRAPPGWAALWKRYAMGTVSLLLGGAGFWWAWCDREHMTWHDRISATRLVREPRRRQ